VLKTFIQHIDRELVAAKYPALTSTNHNRTIHSILITAVLSAVRNSILLSAKHPIPINRD